MAFRTTLPAMAGALLVFGLAAPQPAQAQSMDRQLRAAVERALVNSSRPVLLQMREDDRRQGTDEFPRLVACVNDVMAGIPPQKKRYILEAGRNLQELQARFEKVTSENQSALQKQFVKECG